MNYKQFVSVNLPPSPIDLSFPPLRKGKELQINTKGTDHSKNHQPWTPPLSPPLASGFQDKPLSFSSSMKKNRPSQHTQQMDIVHLTLENAKLQRANRLLKVNREEWLEERIQPLEQHIRDLTASNVRWQRAATLLQQDLEEYHGQMAGWKLDRTLQRVGPEYGFLVDMIHQLQSQINAAHRRRGKHSIDISNSELFVLLDKIHSLEQDLSQALAQLAERDEDLACCRSEVLTKEQVVAKLQLEFDDMDKQIKSLQCMLEEGKTVTSSRAPLPTIQTTSEEMTMMLKATSGTRNKRGRIKQIDHHGGVGNQNSAYEKNEASDHHTLSLSSTATIPDWDNMHFKHRSIVSPSKEQSSHHNTASLVSPFHPASPAIILPLNAMPPILSPGSYPVLSPITTRHLRTTLENDRLWKARIRSFGLIPFIPFVITSWVLSLSTKLGIKYDWLAPIIVLVIVTGLLGGYTKHVVL